MLRFDIVIAGTFRLLRARPGAVLIWGLLYTLVTIGGARIVLPMTHPALLGTPSPVAAPGMLFGALIPYYLAMVLAMLVLATASLRAVLRPGEQAFASLRLGMDELRVLGLSAIVFFLYTVAAMGIGIVAVIVGSIVTSLGGFNGGTIIFSLLVFLTGYGAMIFVSVRLSLAGALTILRRKIVIGEAWTLTRGNFWRLFGAYLVIMVILFAAYAVVASLTMGPYIGALVAGDFSQRAWQAASQAQMAQQLAGFSPTLVLTWAIQTLTGAASIAMWSGAIGAATQALAGSSTADYAATFE